MLPNPEEAWYLLSTSEYPLARQPPNAAEWWLMSIMRGFGQRSGGGKKSWGWVFCIVWNHSVLFFLTRATGGDVYVYDNPLVLHPRL